MGGGSPPDDPSVTPEEPIVQMSSLTLDSAENSTPSFSEQQPVPEQQQQEDQVRLVYSKSKVYVHPTNNNEDNIPGFLYVVERPSRDYILAWTPESLLSADQLESYVQVECYPDADQEEDEETILISPLMSETTTGSPTAETLYMTSVPISSIYSIIVKPPNLTQWNLYGSITVNLIGGITLPSWWFHDDESRSTRLQRRRHTQKPLETSQNCEEREEEDNGVATWGGDEVMRLLGKYSHVFGSSIETNLFLINPLPEDMANHSSPAHQNATGIARNPRPVSMQMDPFTATVKEIRWNVLEQFSKVARFTRDTAAAALEHPLARPILPHLPPGVNSLVQSEPNRAAIDEFDGARIYLAKFAARVAEQAETAAIMEHHGEDRDKQKPATDSKLWEEDTALGVFEVLSSEEGLPSVHDTRTEPLKAEQWFSFFDTEGRLRVEVQEVRAVVFRGGVEEDIRSEVWKFFLGVYPWDSSQVERENIMDAKAQEYWVLKRQWWDSPEVQEDADFQEQKTRIEKDVIRTDRSVPFFKYEDIPHPSPLSGSSSQFTNKNLELMKDILMTYNYYNKDLGYVQGMSDLLAPAFAIMGDEVATFWTFVGFMERMKYNFYRDQSGMRRQLLTLSHLIQFMDPLLYNHLQKTDSLNLFCCFRWLLIWFKREFKWNEVAPLWEVLWSDHLTGQFHLFFALAILDKHRLVLMDHLHNFDEILKYINDLSMEIRLNETLSRAEALFRRFQHRVEAIDKKRMELEQQESNTSEGVRHRKGKEPEEGGKGEESRLPIVSDLLRSLLSKDWVKLS